MISYEASLNCDLCKNAHVAGEVSESAIHARRTCINAGASQGWRVYLTIEGTVTHAWCPDCLKKATVHEVSVQNKQANGER